MTARLSHIATTLTRSRTRELTHAGNPPHISFFVPTHRQWNKRNENRLMLDGLVRQARDELQERGMAEAEATDLLQPVSDLTSNDRFWRTVRDGLAVFVAQNHFSSHRVPFSVPERHFVDQQFHIRPLWKHLVPNGRYYVLALAQGGIKLFRGMRYALREVELEDVPTSLDEELQFDEHIRSLIFHTGAPAAKGGERAAMFHGQEDAGDKAYVKEGILRFFRTLDNEVCRILEQDATPAPLVLAGVDYIRGLYRKVNHYAHVTETDVEGNLVDDANDVFDVKALHERAWEIVEPHFGQERADAEALFEERAGRGDEQTADSIKTAVPAAYAHRIDTLFVSDETVVWGQYDGDAHAVTLHDQPDTTNVELMNAAVVQTLEGNGTVYVVNHDAVPGGGDIAALFRY